MHILSPSSSNNKNFNLKYCNTKLLVIQCCGDESFCQVKVGKYFPISKKAVIVIVFEQGEQSKLDPFGI